MNFQDRMLFDSRDRPQPSVKRHGTPLSNEYGFINIGYVPSIDGLRALAVSSVILFHAYNLVLPAGLIGVDIFFVISGFVVAASVLSHSFAGWRDLFAFFFSRRIRRIAPALIVCLLVTATLTVAFIPESWLSNANLRAGLWAFFGLSNIVLYQASDQYGAPRAEMNPFTQTWSLAVEEQFYLLFPVVTAGIFFWCGRKRSRAISVFAWGMLTTGSLFVAGYHASRDSSAAFYLAPDRFWELGIGVLSYLLLPYILRLLTRLPVQAVSAMAAAGLSAVIASFVFGKTWTAYYPFPAVAPAVFGVATLIVAIIAYPSGFIASALARSGVVYVGKISYSLYLWHWPVFVLMRWTTGLSTFPQIATGVVLSCVLALASYHFVETPVRTGKAIKAMPRIALIGAGLACLLIGWVLLNWMTAEQSRLSLSVTSSDPSTWNPWVGESRDVKLICAEQRNFREYSPGSAIIDFVPVKCSSPMSHQTIFVVGDSHAGAYARIFGNAAVNKGMSFRIYTRPGCVALLLRQPHRVSGPECEAFLNTAFDEISSLARAGDVLFLPGLRVSRFLLNGSVVEYTDDQNDINDQSHREAMSEAKELLQRLTRAGISIVLEAPLPVFRIEAYRCLDWFNRANPSCRHGFEVPRTEIEAMRRDVVESMERLHQEIPRVSVWDPTAVLCDDKICSALKNNKPLFSDGDHLSGVGNDTLFDSWIAHIESLTVHGTIKGVSANQ
jgi:peptidoglycan/LPS O-acetylase OafA/YrhL